jgi:hypothetical protein
MGEVPLITNSGTIAALGTGATLEIIITTVTNSTTKALILASGNGATVDLFDVTVNGGTLKTSAGGEIAATGPDVLNGVTIAASSLIEVDSVVLRVSGGTIGAGAVIETNGGGFGGTAIVSGTVTNGGTLFAQDLGDLVEIASGAVVNGGVALVGDGIVDIAGSLSNGSGGLEIADTIGHTSAYSGRVSGFGGSGHSNTAQFIDLVSVTSAGLITSSYVSAIGNTSGTLFISTGGTLTVSDGRHAASIALLGTYMAGSFVATADGYGGTLVTEAQPHEQTLLAHPRA